MPAKEQFLHLSTRGWRTGNDHDIEIWFVKYDGRYYVISEMGDSSHWVKNIEHNPETVFRVGNRYFQGAGANS